MSDIELLRKWITSVYEFLTIENIMLSYVWLGFIEEVLHKKKTQTRDSECELGRLWKRKDCRERCKNPYFCRRKEKYDQQTTFFTNMHHISPGKPQMSIHLSRGPSCKAVLSHCHSSKLLDAPIPVKLERISTPPSLCLAQ